MTCINLSDSIVCVNPWGRLHVNGKYIYVDFHEYCGPSFTQDRAGTVPYTPVDESDAVWEAFEKWLKKYNESKAKRLREQGKHPVTVWTKKEHHQKIKELAKLLENPSPDR